MEKTRDSQSPAARHDFNRIWAGFSEKVRAYISKRVSDPASVDDVLQEVFLKIHLHMGDLKEEARISSWVFTIASNAVIDFYRRQRGPVAALPDEVPAADETCDSPACEVASGLAGMVEGLPQKYARALTLVDFEGLSFDEASRKLGVSVSGAKSRVQRARKMIKDSLLRCCHFVLDRYGTIIDLSPACCCCRSSSN